MLAYKAFRKGLVCRGYQFRLGEKHTEEFANVIGNNGATGGFHAATDPLDCLSYYPDAKNSVFCIVDCGGDIDEDASDSKVACTELTVIRELTLQDYVLQCLLHIAKNGTPKNNSRIKKERGEALNGYTFVCGRAPLASGKRGDVLGLLQHDGKGNVLGIAVHTVDGDTFREDVYYDIGGREEKQNAG